MTFHSEDSEKLSGCQGLGAGQEEKLRRLDASSPFLMHTVVHIHTHTATTYYEVISSQNRAS